MSIDYTDVIGEMRAMQDRVRAIRTRSCEPKSNTNPRCLALSNVVSNLTKVIEDMESERQCLNQDGSSVWVRMRT